MSTHIEAEAGEVAELVLLPGDPLRAKFIAENFLEDARCYNRVRGMLGFTGTYKGVRVSVQGTGMGQPSLSIYASELFKFYGAKVAIRTGTCGAVSADLRLRDTVIVNAACSDSAMMNRRFGDMHFAATADFSLVKIADKIAEERRLSYKVGTVASSDFFYDQGERWKTWARFGVLGIEMECAELFTLAAEYKRKALAVMSVSDHILLGGETTASERETSFTDMITLALETAARASKAE